MQQTTTAKYVTGNGMRGMLEYFSEDVKGQEILMFRGYDNEAGQVVENLYTREEAVAIFGIVARSLV